MKTDTPTAAAPQHMVWWLVLLAAAGAFALTMGTRQTMGFFLSPLNTATGLGVGSISLAFAFGQLWWGLRACLRSTRGRASAFSGWAARRKTQPG